MGINEENKTMVFRIVGGFVLFIGISQHVGYADEFDTIRHLKQFEQSAFLHEVHFHSSSDLLECHQEQKSHCQSKLLVYEFVEEEEIYFPSTSRYSLLRESLVSPHMKFLNKKFLNLEIYVDRMHRNFEAEILEIFNQSLEPETQQNDAPILLECHCDDREPSAYGYALGHWWGKMVQASLDNIAGESLDIEFVNHGNTYGVCDGELEDCQEESRLQATFKFLAIREPRSGCLIRLRLPIESNHRQTVFEEHPLFLQEIHVAGTNLKEMP